MDRANYALQLIAEGKLNLGISNKNLEMEQMKIKKFLEIIFYWFFWYCNYFCSILIL